MENGIIADALAPVGEVRACTDCEFLLGVRHRIDDAADKWRCCHGENTSGFKQDFVTGIRNRVFKIASIYTVREFNCKGEWWKEYKQPGYAAQELDYTPAPDLEPGKGKKVGKFSLDL